MHECIYRLLRSGSDEESLECFCWLMMTTRKQLGILIILMRLEIRKDILLHQVLVPRCPGPKTKCLGPSSSREFDDH